MPTERDVRAIMKRNHKYLVDNLTNVSSILDDLLAKKVISLEKYENLWEKKDSKKKVRELSLTLANITESGFTKLLQALRDCRQEHVALRLAPDEHSSVVDQVDNPAANFDIIDYDASQVRMRMLDQGQLHERINDNRNYGMSMLLRGSGRIGRVLIVNNLDFDFLDPRYGSERDVELLEAVFKRLHFSVRTVLDMTAVDLMLLLRKECYNFNIYNGYTADQSKATVNREQDSRGDEEAQHLYDLKEDDDDDDDNDDDNDDDDDDGRKMGGGDGEIGDYKDMGVFILVIMSHGGKGFVYGKDGSQYRNYVDIEQMVRLFNGENCPGLNGKPKLIFITACQKDEVLAGGNESIHWRNLKRVGHDDHTIGDVTHHKMSDIFLMKSTVPGEKSLRHTSKGTYFIHILCHTISTHCHNWHLNDLMTEINSQHRSLIIKKHGGCIQQQPTSRTTLNKQFYFLP